MKCRNGLRFCCNACKDACHFGARQLQWQARPTSLGQFWHMNGKPTSKTQTCFLRSLISKKMPCSSKLSFEVVASQHSGIPKMTMISPKVPIRTYDRQKYQIQHLQRPWLSCHPRRAFAVRHQIATELSIILPEQSEQRPYLVSGITTGKSRKKISNGMTSSSLVPKNHLISSFQSSVRCSRNLFHYSDENISNSTLRHALEPRGLNESVRSYFSPQRWPSGLIEQNVDKKCSSQNIQARWMASLREITTKPNSSKLRRHRQARAIKKRISLPSTKDRIRNPSLYRGTTSSSKLTIMGNKLGSTSKEVLAERLETRLNWARQGIENIMGVQRGSEAVYPPSIDVKLVKGDNQPTITPRPKQREGIVMDTNWWFWNILLAATPAAFIAMFCEFYAKPIALAEQERRLELQALLDNNTSDSSEPQRHPRRDESQSRQHQMNQDNNPETGSLIPWYKHQFLIFQVALAQYLLGSQEENILEQNKADTVAAHVASNGRSPSDNSMKQSTAPSTVPKVVSTADPGASTANVASDSFRRQDEDRRQPQPHELNKPRSRLQALEKEIHNHRPLRQNEQSENNTVAVTRRALAEITKWLFGG